MNPDVKVDDVGGGFDRRLAHLYNRERSDPGWGQRQAWGLDGADPSVSIYDQDFGASDLPLHRIIANGMIRMFRRLPLDAPTITRSGRVAAQHNTLPAARFFGSYTAAGTGRSWSPLAVAQGQRSLRLGWNPNMQGAAELHPATTYDPFPAPGSLYPKVV